MVFIHGGAFKIGSGTTENHGPERLLDFGIVSCHMTFTFTEKICIFNVIALVITKGL